MSSDLWLSKHSLLLVIPLLACTSFAQVPPQSRAAGVAPTSGSDRARPSGTTGESSGVSSDHSTSSVTPGNSDEHSRSVGLQAASIRGTVTDANDGPISGAVVTVHGIAGREECSVQTNGEGYFETRDLKPGISYTVTVTATGFVTWQSPAIVLEPGESKFINASKLQILEVETSIIVSPEDPVEVATEEVKAEEHQRGFLIIPNFYAVYAPNPAPLSSGLKFRLALHVARDPFTLGGITTYAAAQQAAGNPHFVQGAKGYAERFGANSVTSFADIMLDGAVLPSLLHQDPRYFYKGTGTRRSRMLHVISSLVVTRGDNGRLEPNVSGIGGDLASSALANLYYPRANRGVGLVMQGFGIDTSVHIAIRMLDEFAFHPSRAVSQ